MSEIRMESSGRFGTSFHKALVEQNLSLVEFARKIDSHYESLRKVFQGKASPGKYLLPVICKSLKMNLKEMQALDAQDKMERKLGSPNFNAALGRPAASSAFDALIPHLTESEIQLILAQMKMMVKQKKGKV